MFRVQSIGFTGCRVQGLVFRVLSIGFYKVWEFKEGLREWVGQIDSTPL